MRDLSLDLRFALRTLRRSPMFTFVAVFTLALGIGATTAIFSVVDTLILRSLPFPDADRIVTVWQNNTRDNVPRDAVSPANFLDWRERNTAFEYLAGAEPFSFDLVGTDGQPEVLMAALVTEGFFEIFRTQPTLGRTFRPEDHAPGARIVVISHGLWQRRFGGDSTIVGRTLSLDGQPATVVGVLPPTFEVGIPEVGTAREIWAARSIREDDRQTRGTAWWNVVGRTKGGIRPERAAVDLNRVADGLAVEYPETNAGIGVSVVPLHAHMVGNVSVALYVLLGAVVLVLLIACANVANLLIARAAERDRELAVRAALGAGRARLLRHMLAESVLLAIGASVFGVALAQWGVDVIVALSPGDILRMESVSIDARVLTFAVGLCAFTAIAVGLIPAWQFSRPNLHHAMQEGRVTAGSRRQRVRSGLIVGEVALALMLLVGASLLLRSFVTLLDVDPGFRRDNVVALQVFAWEGGQTAQDRVLFFEQTIDRMTALPGVVAAGAVSAAPFIDADIAIQRSFTIDDRPTPRAGEEPNLFLTYATPGFFEALAIPVRSGRGLDGFDRSGTPLVGVVSERMARRYWPGIDPVGRTITLGGESPTQLEIVGVVGDVRHTGLDTEPRAELFIAHAQSGFGSMTYFVRTAGDPTAALASLRDQVWAVNPNLTFYQTGVLGDLIANTLSPRRFVLLLLGGLAGVALTMAAVGIYGVISYTVGQRTREVGIRMALGAVAGDVVRLVLVRGMLLSAGGIAIGVVGALAGTRLLSSLLFEIPPWDIPAFALAATALLGSALIACFLPARRATRVNPMEALRHE